MTIITRAGYKRDIDVDTEFVRIVGILSRDKAVRDLAAYGSAALGDADR